ncbi:MAG: PRC-barrel domain-containing protein [Pseudorhodoplanes sp.]|nr:PRC-barrel domain-containing protein [Pseudorhodoplanes sp.]
MLKKLMLTTAIGGLMMSGAIAQTTPPNTSTNAPAAAAQATPGTATVTMQTSDQMLSSKFIGTDVIGANDEKIGDVSDILFDRNGMIQAYVVGVGGFLGIGAKDVAIEPKSFQIVKGENNSADKLRLSMTKDQLQQHAEFKPYEASRSTTGSGTSGAMAPRPAGSTAPAR